MPEDQGDNPFAKFIKGLTTNIRSPAHQAIQFGNTSRIDMWDASYGVAPPEDLMSIEAIPFQQTTLDKLGDKAFYWAAGQRDWYSSIDSHTIPYCTGYHL